MTRPVGLAILSMVVYRPLCRSLICLVALSNPPAIRSMAAPPTLSDSPGVAAVEPPVSPLPPSAPVSPPSVVVALLSPVVTLPAPYCRFHPHCRSCRFHRPLRGRTGCCHRRWCHCYRRKRCSGCYCHCCRYCRSRNWNCRRKNCRRKNWPEPVILPLLLPTLVFEPAPEPPPDGLSLPEGLPPTLSLP